MVKLCDGNKVRLSLALVWNCLYGSGALRSSSRRHGSAHTAVDGRAWRSDKALSRCVYKSF